MTVMEQFQKQIDSMYRYYNKAYKMLEENGMDEELVEIINSANGPDEEFLAEQLKALREIFDQTYFLVSQLHKPILYDGRMKKTKNGGYALCKLPLKKKIGIEYVWNGKWKFGIFEPGTKNDECRIVDDKMQIVDVALENLRVRTREHIEE